ncbi:MAG: lactonase family protein [Chitinophagaceae bacterium]|nr:lactonase family protein [Chitinophagaceae bacterium]
MKHKFLLLVFLFLYGVTAKAQQLSYLITGTYTSGKSEGIYVYQFNSDHGSAKAVSSIKISNPSFVAVSPDEKFVYSVEEDAANNGKEGEVSAFSFNKETGKLSFLNRKPTGGDHPCYVSVDKTGRWVAAGNYSSGSLSLMPVLADGSLGTATSIIRHEGSGPNIGRQASPHVHGTFFSPDNRFLFVPDLGIDKVMIYAFDETTGKLTTAKQAFAESLPGSGPRHISFHPSNKYAYLMQELSGTVTAFKYKNGKLKSRQIISSMPAGDTSFAGSADIHVSPDGKFLYASNRAESNTIAIFSINQKNGKLSPVGHQSTLGKTPRNFNFDPAGNFLLVANQNSDQVVIFKINKETGLLTDTGNRIDVGKPVCLKWISIQ